MPWGTIAISVIVAGALVALMVLNRKYGFLKAEKKQADASLEGRERFDDAVDEHEASGGLAGAAERKLRDASGEGS
jgi:hypothetical protein